MKLRWPFDGVQTIILGMTMLAASLVERHVDALHSDLMIVVLHWAGTVLVIVGLGRILFLEDRW
jgi:hypothetical protein